MTSNRVPQRQVREPRTEKDADPPVTDSRALLDCLRIELEVVDRKVHDMKGLIEWEAPRAGPVPGEEVVILRDIIAALMNESPPGAWLQKTAADYESIMRAAMEQGLLPVRVDAWLKKWVAEGRLYRPSKNRYLFVGPQ
mgnify:FL=1